jgi:serine/threonine-protein kinase RsbW
MRHAYDSPKDGLVRLRIGLGERALELQIVDQGRGFDITRVPAPLPGEPQEGGYGVFLMKRVADELRYVRDGRENVLIMRFDVPEGKEGVAHG